MNRIHRNQSMSGKRWPIEEKNNALKMRIKVYPARIRERSKHTEWQKGGLPVENLLPFPACGVSEPRSGDSKSGNVDITRSAEC